VKTVPRARQNVPGVERLSESDPTVSSWNSQLACQAQEQQAGVERCVAARTLAARAIKLCNREQRDHGHRWPATTMARIPVRCAASFLMNGKLRQRGSRGGTHDGGYGGLPLIGKTT